MAVLLTLLSIFHSSSIFNSPSIHLNSRTKLEKHKDYWLILVILVSASHFATTLQDGTNTVFVRENGTAKLQWSLFIGENAGWSLFNVMIKKRDALLCQWVKGHWEVNRCDPGMNLTISPRHVPGPGPTNFTATFSFRNKGRVDDGTYECRFVIDEKWHEMQVYPRHLVTTAKPIVTSNATNSNACITNIICHVRGGRPKPVETILIKNGTEISRSKLKWQEEAGYTDGDEVSLCTSIHSVENSGGQCKCRVEYAGYVVDSAEVDIPSRRKENETYARNPGLNDRECAANNVKVTFTSLIVALVFVLVLVCLHILVWQIRKHMKTRDQERNVKQMKEETEQGFGHISHDNGSVEIVLLEMDNEHRPSQTYGCGSGVSHLPYRVDVGNGSNTYT